MDPARADVDDLRLAVHGVGDDPRLRAGERDRLVAEILDRHRRERARDPLADRDEHVQLARLRRRRDLVGEVDQLVGRVAHRREHADDAVPLLARGDEPRGDALELLRIADRGAAELQHDACRGAAPRHPRRPPERLRTRSWPLSASVDEAPETSRKLPQKTLNRRTRRPVGSDGENLRIGPNAVKRPQGESSLFALKIVPALHLAPAGERAAESDLVGVLEVAADGQAAGEPRHARRGRGAGRRGRRRSPRRSCSGWSRARPRDAVPARPAAAARRSAGARARRRRAARARRRARGRARGTRACARARSGRRAARRRRRPCGRAGCRVQIPHSSSSVRFPHSRQKRTRSFTSTIAAASASASSFGTRRMWKASRCAVREPTPGRRVSCATRFSTAGLNTAPLCLEGSEVLPSRALVAAPRARALSWRRGGEARSGRRSRKQAGREAFAAVRKAAARSGRPGSSR